MNLINKYATFFFLFLEMTFQLYAQSKPIDLTSPNGELKVTINLGDKIYYSVTANNEELLTKNHLALALKEGALGENPKLISAKKTKAEEIIAPYVSLKFSQVKSVHTTLLLTFKGDYAVEFRAFDDGIAYRFISHKIGDTEVMSEDFSINFPGNYLLHLQLNNGFKTSYEELYQHIESTAWKQADKMANLPVLIDTKKQYKILISESDLSDYPGMWEQQ